MRYSSKMSYISSSSAWGISSTSRVSRSYSICHCFAFVFDDRYSPNPMESMPEKISASPPMMTNLDEPMLQASQQGPHLRRHQGQAYEDKPAVKAKGTVRPSAIPKTALSRYSLLAEWVSACVWGSSTDGMPVLMSSEATDAMVNMMRSTKSGC